MTANDIYEDIWKLRYAEQERREAFLTAIAIIRELREKHEDGFARAVLFDAIHALEDEI
jgi:hypothetical protein